METKLVFYALAGIDFLLHPILPHHICPHLLLLSSWATTLKYCLVLVYIPAHSLLLQN